MTDTPTQAERTSRGWTRTFNPALTAEIKLRWDSYDVMLDTLRACEITLRNRDQDEREAKVLKAIKYAIGVAEG